jgi:hypothetical protein
VYKNLGWITYYPYSFQRDFNSVRDWGCSGYIQSIQDIKMTYKFRYKYKVTLPSTADINRKDDISLMKIYLKLAPYDGKIVEHDPDDGNVYYNGSFIMSKSDIPKQRDSTDLRWLILASLLATNI